MFNTFAAVALTGAVSAFSQSQFEFMQYIAKQGKTYATVEEFNMRMELFAQRNAIIEEWNADDTVTSKMGHNFLSDWTVEEKAKLTGLIGEPEASGPKLIAGNSPIANAVDWVTAGKVGPVKDQGQCGSCWAFSATGSVESSIAIAEGSSPLSYSEQQLTSCSSAYGNNGCGGGWYYWAWDYLKVNAQESSANYPYTSGVTTQTGTCTANTSLGVAKVTSYSQVGQTNADIMAAINTRPVSVAIDAQRATFQSYTSGVITTGCGTLLDHAVMAVGYGNDPVTGLDYFLVRNSWGASWGDNGYVKIGQSSTGTAPGYCGINKAVYTVNAVSV